ncbi:MAG: GIY-YIG nuclease family protein [Candidatus Marinimicrobia bacterium]|nr:GIY-YIG nuclease family protein [Candidatus Neomarinimicrobiota bacterium]MBL7010397.1 GIY-YIG nuclease family protein [Candidatus Neomarinimicrobiota bacterium]MBL7030842.1 GIY-YIG nuclease family protein [Candidatus Neomarinimicrobiota bacterium]
MYYTYILKSEKDNKYYIGSTENLETRLNVHNSGSVKSTKNQRSLKLVWSEKYSTRAEAMGREKQIKRFKGGEAFKQLLN